AAGANISYTEWPNLGHGCWNQSWALPEFPVYMNKAHKANPWPLFGRTEFCPGESINQVIGVMAGFDGYEWRKDGVLIPGATSNTYTATSLGVFSCRIRRGTEWSPWSPSPVELKLKGVTVPPSIQINGLFSNVIPAPDGNTGVELIVPTGYATYNWQREGSPTVLSTTNTLYATTPGQYKVQVTEQFGCSSVPFSSLFPVIDANGPNGPPPVSGLIATVLSKTEIKLDWAQNNSPSYNETGFEIYMASSAAGPYKLIAITAPDVTTFTHSDLLPDTDYFYKVRAINNTAASSVVGPAAAKTQADTSPPTAPANLRVGATTRNSVELIWDESTDDVGVIKYDIYVNGIKYYESDVAYATVYNLNYQTTYAFKVKARDFAGNVSPFSNQVTGQPISNGLNYKYYTYTGTWDQLPDFNTLVPDATGVVPNITLENRTQNDNFAYLWEGLIKIPASGNYRFRTRSDDGSRLWIGALGSQVSPYSYSGTPEVNNDGLHGPQNRNGPTRYFEAGTYPIAIAFYEQGGGETMEARLRQYPSSSYNLIPDSYFADEPIINGYPPVKPSGLTANALTSSEIELNWIDNSGDETGFEVWRSTDPVNNFVTVGNAQPNATSFIDSSLDANTTYYYNLKSLGQYGESDFAEVGSGVDYSYYEVDNMNNLPDFNSLTPQKTGRISTFSLGEQDRGDNFAFKFSGFITVPVAGDYIFYTTSDDGSKLYIDGFDEAHKVVDNDYLQGPTERSGTINLTAGIHEIHVTFFERGGGEFLEVRYEGPAGSGIAKQLIPADVLGLPLPNATTLPLPSVPLDPSDLVATGTSSSKISVTWNDNSGDETKFEL
ncbi:MAG: fibronectin type III domain-containing protein, partial [Chitinophagales bacterium]|nr:fibronectin type III domain-containing protein [Chitinophagales bacterium]